MEGISKEWIGLQSVIKVIRDVTSKNRTTQETAYLISSLSPTTKASVVSQGIRSHWLIENSLHYVKDVAFREDNCRVRQGNAPANLSIMRNIAINIFRGKGLKNIKSAIRKCSNNAPYLAKLLLE